MELNNCSIRTLITIYRNDKPMNLSKLKKTRYANTVQSKQHECHMAFCRESARALHERVKRMNIDHIVITPLIIIIKLSLFNNKFYISFSIANDGIINCTRSYEPEPYSNFITKERERKRQPQQHKCFVPFFACFSCSIKFMLDAIF